MNKVTEMARKRIKTLATEWGVTVDDLLASCARLHLSHAHSESSLLSRDETERVKVELDERAQRAAAIPRETVVETSAGTVVEKRLNANVMRRRHSEPVPVPAPQEMAEPFNFEPGPTQNETAFVAPVFDEPPKLEDEIPELTVMEPEPAPVASEPPAVSAQLQLRGEEIVSETAEHACPHPHPAPLRLACRGLPSSRKSNPGRKRRLRLSVPRWLRRPTALSQASRPKLRQLGPMKARFKHRLSQSVPEQVVSKLAPQVNYRTLRVNYLSAAPRRFLSGHKVWLQLRARPMLLVHQAFPLGVRSIGRKNPVEQSI